MERWLRVGRVSAKIPTSRKEREKWGTRLHAKTGAKLWSYATGYPVLSSPAIANGVVYVGSGGLETSGKIYALNAKSGTKLWSYDPGTTVVSSPAVANGVVYVGSGFQNYPSKLYALNAQTGAKLWSYTARNAVDSSPAVVNGVVFIGSEDGNLYAFSLKKGRE